ncbi:sarcosine oxidase subunit gamma [Rhodobaculum claviforme]|uniref:sarcosine oxidase subunit gamma n=1 Tax=Rhodobaculum claviforme TaxID=1549854 RepID=UPI001913834C|nr:sarcosine oxidase subunit gamma [Rhodobaculum claviforme]
MAELIAGGPLDGTPIQEGAGCTLEVLDLGPVSAIQPWPGRGGAVDAALKARGLGFPEPGRSLEVAGTRIVWAGRETAFLIGIPAPELGDAAVIDLTDGWVGLALSGTNAGAVLARLVPIDLRPVTFAEGAAARTLVGHVPALILRRGGALEVMVTRSYLRTVWHEIGAAMRTLAARATAGS